MARDRARKASEAKAKMMMAKVASGKHAKQLMGTAITVGNGDTRKKDGFTKSESKGGKGKSAGSLDESEENGPENTSVGGFGLCSFRNHNDDWKWNKCRKVTFTLDSGAAVSAAPKSLGDTTRCKSKNRDRTRQRRVLLCKMKDFECCRIVTEEGLHRCMNSRVAPVHKALVSASKVCRKGYRIILDSEPG